MTTCWFRNRNRPGNAYVRRDEGGVSEDCVKEAWGMRAIDEDGMCITTEPLTNWHESRVSVCQERGIKVETVETSTEPSSSVSFGIRRNSGKV